MDRCQNGPLLVLIPCLFNYRAAFVYIVFCIEISYVILYACCLVWSGAFLELFKLLPCQGNTAVLYGATQNRILSVANFI